MAIAKITQLVEKGQKMFFKTHVEAVEGLPEAYAKLPNSEPLWEGALLMKENQSLRPTKKLSECINGWIVQFKMFHEEAVVNGSIQYGLILKVHGGIDSGKAVVVPLSLYSGESAGVKYLYPSDTEIKGYKNNSTAPSNQFVLTAVYEF